MRKLRELIHEFVLLFLMLVIFLSLGFFVGQSVGFW